MSSTRTTRRTGAGPGARPIPGTAPPRSRPRWRTRPAGAPCRQPGGQDPQRSQCRDRRCPARHHRPGRRPRRVVAGYLRRAVEVLEDDGRGERRRHHAGRRSDRLRACGGARDDLAIRHRRCALPRRRRCRRADTVYLGVFRREVLERLGGYDEHFARAQDWELNYRIRNAGETVWFTPDLVVTYRPRGSLAALAKQFFGSGQWRREMVRRHPGTVSPRYLAAPVATASVGRGNRGGSRVGARGTGMAGSRLAGASRSRSREPSESG